MSSSAASPSRQEKAAKIAADPSSFKVCEGCDSIVSHRTVICPNCHSFRFDAEAKRVVEQAKELGNREQTSVTLDDFK